MRILNIAATIASSIKSNNLHVKQIESIQVDCIEQVPLHAIWLRRQRKQVCHPLDCAYRDNISGSDAEKRLTTVASIAQRLQQRLMSLLNNNHTSSLTYWPCCKCLKQCKNNFNASFSILNDKKTLQPCANAFSCQLKVVIRTRPHPEKYSIIWWWLILSPPCGPCATNLINCLLVTLKRYHQNCHWIVPKYILHCWEDWNSDCDWYSLWSQQITWNTEQCDSVAPLLTLHTTWSSHQRSWFLVVGFSSFAWSALWLEAFHCCDVVLHHLHSALNTKTSSFGPTFAKAVRRPHDDRIVGTLR